jgi:hypothetical protein
MSLEENLGNKLNAIKPKLKNPRETMDFVVDAFGAFGAGCIVGGYLLSKIDFPATALSFYCLGGYSLLTFGAGKFFNRSRCGSCMYKGSNFERKVKEEHGITSPRKDPCIVLQNPEKSKTCQYYQKYKR